MKLCLDDRRPAPAGWTRAYTVAEAQAYLQTGEVEEASLAASG
jgi:NAD+-processing family protein with receiver domain